MERENAETSQPRTKFKFDMSKHGWWAGVILALVVVIGFALWFINVVSDKVTSLPPGGGLPVIDETLMPAISTMFCAPGAASQLPRELAGAVNTTQAQAKVAASPASQILLERHIGGDNLKAVAFIAFDPKYCGYWGNINFYPVTGRQLPAYDFSREYDKDTVALVRDGKPFSPGNNICISNIPPTAQVVDGGIKMVFSCDRDYPVNTWTQQQPRLTP